MNCGMDETPLQIYMYRLNDPDFLSKAERGLLPQSPEAPTYRLPRPLFVPGYDPFEAARDPIGGWNRYARPLGKQERTGMGRRSIRNNSISSSSTAAVSSDGANGPKTSRSDRHPGSRPSAQIQANNIAPHTGKMKCPRLPVAQGSVKTGRPSAVTAQESPPLHATETSAPVTFHQPICQVHIPFSNPSGFRPSAAS